jgi:hypothetical protein
VKTQSQEGEEHLSIIRHERNPSFQQSHPSVVRELTEVDDGMPVRCLLEALNMFLQFFDAHRLIEQLDQYASIVEKRHRMDSIQGTEK